MIPTEMLNQNTPSNPNPIQLKPTNHYNLNVKRETWKVEREKHMDDMDLEFLTHTWRIDFDTESTNSHSFPLWI